MISTLLLLTMTDGPNPSFSLLTSRPRSYSSSHYAHHPLKLQFHLPYRPRRDYDIALFPLVVVVVVAVRVVDCVPDG